MAWSPALLIASFALVAACSTDEPLPPSEPSPLELFSSAIERVELEVDFAEGAEPYTGSIGIASDLWDITRANADALFGGEKQLVIPHRLADMQAIGAIEGESFDLDEILELAERHRDRPSQGDTATFYALWLDGYYRKDDEVSRGTLGVSIRGTGVIAMFKPVIRDSSLVAVVAAYVEQATLVHELGHAVGLVNNGLPLASDHHDAENGAHCDRTDCVMYYTIEGTVGAVQHAQQAIQNGDQVLFGPACLGDAEAARSETHDGSEVARLRL